MVMESIYFPGCNRSWIHSRVHTFATITAESVNINKSQDSEEVLMTSQNKGNTYEVPGGYGKRMDKEGPGQ